MTDHRPPVSGEPSTERASLTLNTKYGAALWLGDRLVARIAAGIEQSRITPDDPIPQWRKDAMTFVNAVNEARATPPSLDVERLATIFYAITGQHIAGSPGQWNAIAAEYARLTTEGEKP